MLPFTIFFWSIQYASWSRVELVTQESENRVSDVGVSASNRLLLSIISVDNISVQRPPSIFTLLSHINM
jgi:hypothetical protein